MDFLLYRFALERLRQIGFSAEQIDRLSRLRSKYTTLPIMDQTLIDVHRLEFVR